MKTEEEKNTIDFDELVSKNSVIINNNNNNKMNNFEDKPMTLYLHTKSLNSIHEYNLAFLRLVKTLKVTKISRAYYFRYYAAVLFQDILSPLAYILMMLCFLFLFLSNLDLNLKMYGNLFIGLLYTPIFIYIKLLKNLELNINDIFYSKLLNPLSFFFGDKWNKLNNISSKYIKLLRQPEYIHTLALLKNFRTKEYNLTKELGIFNIIDFDMFIQSISNNNEKYLKECLVKFGIYLEEIGEQLSQITNEAKNSQFFNETQESEYINIELKNEHTLPENPAFSKDPSLQKKIYEEKIWSKKHKDVLAIVDGKINNIYSPNHTNEFKNSLNNIKKFW